MCLLHVHEVEFERFAGFRPDAEIEPIRVPSSIYISLQNQIVLVGTSFDTICIVSLECCV